MSTTVEREVVQMVFDAQQFQTGVKGSIDSIEQLKKSFDFTAAQDSMGQLTKMGQGDHFGPMSKSLEALNSKISLVGVMAATAVSRLTNAVIDGSKKLFDTLILAPIKTGLAEYETQLNAVQTILANTKKDGTTLEYVNEKLDELNTYADQTIYNFTQMTDSIGKFTAAGVDIDTSVAAIKGIANVAAISGSNAQQASTAMYQLSQAMASGTVRLQDWMSVENAGMGGAVFQDALIETAKVHGVAVDQMIEKNGSFRLSLQEGWLSSDLMAETLSKFTGDLTDAELEAIGYTQEQIVAIQEMAVAANDAATKIKTLTQLKDTMAEAMQSGWGATWRIIFGDFEEAKSLWGGIAEVFGGIIQNSSDARNSMLEMWAEVGGRISLVDGFMNVLQAVINILGAFGSAIREIFEPLTYVDLFDLTWAFFQFSEKLLEFSQNLDPFKTIVKGIAAGLDILLIAAKAIIGPILEMVRGIIPAGDGFLDFSVGIANAVIAFREWAIETSYFDNIVAAVIAKIGELIGKVKSLVQEFLSLEIIQDISTWFGRLDSADFVKVWEGFLTVLRVIVTPIAALAIGLRELYLWASKLDVIQKFTDYINSISYSGIKTGLKDIATQIRAVIDSVKNSDIIAKFIEYFNTFDGRRITQFLEDAKSGFGWLTGIFGKLTDQMSAMNVQAEDANENMEQTGSKLGEGITAMLDKLIENASQIDYSKLFDAINTGLVAALVLSLRKLAGGTWLKDALQSVLGSDSAIGGVGESLQKVFGSVENTMVSVQSNIKADTLQKIAISIALLAGSIVLLTYIDSNKLLAASAAIGTMMAALFGSAMGLKNMDTGAAVKAAIAISGMAASLVIVSVALRALQGIDPEQVETTIAVMVAGIASLVLGVSGLSRGAGDSGTAKTIALMISLSAALYLIHGAIKRFGEMKPDVLTQGILGISASLGVLVTSMLVISRLSGGGLIKAALSISEMAANLLILSAVVNKFGNMDMEVLAQGLQAIGIVMGGFAVASRLLSDSRLIEAGFGMIAISIGLNLIQKSVLAFGNMDWDEIQRGLVALGGSLLMVVLAGRALTGAVGAAVAMTIMSVALVGFAVALKLMSTIPWEGLAVAMLALVGVFVILGLAGYLLGPVVPILLGLGAAMLLIGLSAAALGVGVSLAASGLVLLAGSAAAISAGIYLVAEAVAKTMPGIAAAVAEGFVAFLQVIADNTPLILDATTRIILGMIEGIWGMIPDIVKVILELMTRLLEAIASKIPDMVQAGFDILMGFLKGIRDNIADVVEMGLQIVVEFINGITEGLPRVIDAAFELILAFLDGLADAIETHLADIISAAGRIGIAIIDGIMKGMADNIQRVWDFVTGVANSVVDKILNAFGIESPSKVTAEIGGYLMDGLIVGMSQNVSQVLNAVDEFANSIQNGMESMAGRISGALDDVLVYNPIITPVLNLEEVYAGSQQLDTLFRGSPGLTAIARTETGNLDSAIVNVPVGANGGAVVYNQYNYSPKSLDRAAIYRQTKTQVAKLALKE